MMNLDHQSGFDERINVDEITSPIGAQLFEFCESDLFQNSEVDSSSNCCYEEQSSYQTNPSAAPDMSNYNNQHSNASIDNEQQLKPPCIVAPTGGNSTGPSTPTITTGNGNLSIIFDNPVEDHIENDISVSIDFTPLPAFSNPQNQYLSNNGQNATTTTTTSNSNQEPFNISSLNNQLSLQDMINGPLQTGHQFGPERWPNMAPPVPLLGPPLPTSYEEECLPSVPSYLRLSSSNIQPPCSLIEPLLAPYLPSASMNPPFSSESSGMFTVNSLMLGSDLSHQEFDFQGDNGGLFLSDNVSRVFNCSPELQALSSESHHFVHGGTNSTPLASEISSLEDPTFKGGKLSVEERKRKIHRYMKKRNERNFSKKIKYACRKTLADSRPRVRGRFAKNDELNELARTSGSNLEEDTDEDIGLFSNSIPDHRRKVAVKEDNMDSSDIFAHISGVNSFKCNYPIQSWI